MGKFVMAVGILWGLGGCYNIMVNVNNPVFKGEAGGFMMLFNMVLFVIPGIIIMGFGTLLDRKKK